MGYKLRIDQKAITETVVAANHYKMISEALAIRFLNELNLVYNKITANPEYYSYTSKRPDDTLRDLKLKHFPFVVVFEIKGDEVFVSSVWDTRRKPDIS